MTALRRKTRIRGFPVAPLDCNNHCEICGKSRSTGNHTKCSVERKARADAARAKEKES